VRKILAVTIFIAIFAVASVARAEMTFGASSRAGYNDNVSNAQNAGDKISDEFLTGSASLSQVWIFGSNYVLSAGGDLNGEWFSHLSGLRNASIDAALSLRRKWGLGSLAPWARLSLVGGRTGYDDSYRNLTYYRATIDTGKRISARFNLLAAYVFEHHDGSIPTPEYGEPPADVFSQNAHSVAITLEFSALSSLLMDVGLSARHGDVVSTTPQNPDIYYGSRAAVEDPAFGPEEYAYRIIGTTYGVHAGTHYALNEHHLIGFEVKYFSTRASGNNYNNVIPEITWSYRY
jgi:hypothetical protein